MDKEHQSRPQRDSEVQPQYPCIVCRYVAHEPIEILDHYSENHDFDMTVYPSSKTSKHGSGPYSCPLCSFCCQEDSDLLMGHYQDIHDIFIVIENGNIKEDPDADSKRTKNKMYNEARVSTHKEDTHEKAHQEDSKEDEVPDVLGTQADDKEEEEVADDQVMSKDDTTAVSEAHTSKNGSPKWMTLMNEVIIKLGECSTSVAESLHMLSTESLREITKVQHGATEIQRKVAETQCEAEETQCEAEGAQRESGEVQHKTTDVRRSSTEDQLEEGE